MLLSLARLGLHLVLTCALVIAGLTTSFYVEREHGQMGVAYVGLFVVFLLFGLPLCLLVAVATELVWKRKRLLFIPILLAFAASWLFLQTDRLSPGTERFYFTSDRDKAPVLIGRSLEPLNPKPNTQMSNVGTYFPIIAATTFFLPLATWWALAAIGKSRRGKPRES